MAALTAPSNYATQINGDGTIDVFSNGDNSRQELGYAIFRVASNAIDGPAQLWINEAGPVWASAVNFPGNALQVGTAISPINLASTQYAYSPSGDALVFALTSGSLPPGLSLSSAGLISGTPTAGGAYTFYLSATDYANVTAPSPQNQITIGQVVVPINPPQPPYSNNLPNKAPPSKRIIDDRSLVFGLAGPEQPYPTYQFSGNRVRWEYPKHNPFAGE